MIPIIKFYTVQQKMGTSTLVGQHSTARLSIILASSSPSNSTAALHRRTEFGVCSRAAGKKIEKVTRLDTEKTHLF